MEKVSLPCRNIDPCKPGPQQDKGAITVPDWSHSLEQQLVVIAGGKKAGLI